MERVRRFVYENGLSLFFLGLFLVTVVGQSVAGLFEHNDHQRLHGEPTISYGRYVVSSDFGADVLENWQSEWLQFWVFALATIWLLQKGSNESKKLGDEGLEDDKQQRVGRFAPERAPRWAKVMVEPRAPVSSTGTLAKSFFTNSLFFSSSWPYLPSA